jgi:predicted butyrate kinase (DUF1464 family)
MPRVAGCDPGTSALDILALEAGRVAAQVRFQPDELRTDPTGPVRWLRETGPFDLIVGPSGYGLPLVRAADCTEAQLGLISLVRPDEPGAKGVGGFSALVRAIRDSGLPVVFLPGVIHLSTVPTHRKRNRIDLGTADKLCVAALASWQHASADPALVVEFGSAFTALVVLRYRQIVDGLGGTCGPLGGLSGGAWDGEAAYLLGPLRKADLFRGGVADGPDHSTAGAAFRESFAKAVAGLQYLHGFRDVYSGGTLFRTQPDLAREALSELPADVYSPHDTCDLPGAWVKHAAQGAALIADGLCGGPFAPLVEWLKLREACGTVLDWLTHPRAAEVRGWFGA